MSFGRRFVLFFLSMWNSILSLFIYSFVCSWLKAISINTVSIDSYSAAICSIGEQRTRKTSMLIDFRDECLKRYINILLCKTRSEKASVQGSLVPTHDQYMIKSNWFYWLSCLFCNFTVQKCNRRQIKIKIMSKVYALFTMYTHVIHSTSYLPRKNVIRNDKLSLD